MPQIHQTAIIDPKAEIADNVSIGPFTIVKGNVTIDEGTEIHAHALIDNGARIGKNCKIHHGAVISSIPQDLKFEGEETTLEIGDHTEIREYCDLNRGTKDHWKTTIGSNCFLMAYSHVAHDCTIGDRVILANAVQIAGHVTIEDWVILGGMVPVHQFVKIGKHVIIGGGYRVVQDVPPFIMAAGDPIAYKGINLVGLKRRGFSLETTNALKKFYRILFRSKLNLSQAMQKIQDEMEVIPEIQDALDFIHKSERGIIR